MQTAMSTIWIGGVDSVSYDDNRYAWRASYPHPKIKF